jgi:cytochrome c oxidase subunit II
MRNLKKLGAAAAGCLFSTSIAFAAGYPAAGSGAPSAVKDPAVGWDHLWREVIIDITIIGVVFALITAWLLWRYRHRPGNETGHAPKLSPAAAVAWVVIPTFVFLADDLYVAANGWQLWNVYREVPAERLEISLETGMYSFDYTYPNGLRTQNELKVPAGKPVLLRMTSRDTLHNHFIPDFRVKEDSMPGRITYLWFLPKEAGKQHVVSCAAYCGVMHSYMASKIVVLSPEDYKAWYDKEGAKLNETKSAAEQTKAMPARKS